MTQDKTTSVVPRGEICLEQIVTAAHTWTRNNSEQYIDSEQRASTLPLEDWPVSVPNHMFPILNIYYLLFTIIFIIYYICRMRLLSGGRGIWVWLYVFITIIIICKALSDAKVCTKKCSINSVLIWFNWFKWNR